jgi:hypothetical protein
VLSIICETEKQALELVVTYTDVDGKHHEAKNTIEVLAPRFVLAARLS